MVTNISSKILLVIIAIGIWVIVFQNAGIIPTNQNVKVVNEVDTYVRDGKIEAYGSVSVDNEVEVDIRKINGWDAANYRKYTLDGREFHSLGTN